MMKKQKHKGFILIVVIMIMATMGLEMYILADIANTMLLQSNTAYLEACQRNLTASGIAWAKQNIQNITGENAQNEVQLDVKELDIKGSELKLKLSSNDKEPEVQISTTCSRGRQTLKSSVKYRIRL